MAQIHLRHLNPLPANLGELLAGFEAVLVPELNNGQLATLLRDRLLIEVAQLNQVSGQPFPVAAVKAAIAEHAPPAPRGGPWPRGRTMAELTFKDFASDQEVRWCPGCGDYSILKAVQRALATCGADPAKTVFISGIGCAARLPYYIESYGFHTIHGRAPAIATGAEAGQSGA